MSILNTLPNVLIRGENYNFCAGFFNSYKALIGTKKLRDQTATNFPFYGADAVNDEQYLLDIRSLIKNQIVPFSMADNISMWGFKEIRWVQNFQIENKSNYIDYLNFFEKLFPEAGFIVLTRQLELVAKSKWWAKMPRKKVQSSLSCFDSVIEEWSKDKKNIFKIDYSKMIDFNSNSLFDLLAWLGANTSEEQVFNINKVRSIKTPF
jgi:hypothetical protein